MVWIAFGVHLLASGLIGFAAVRLGRRFLPEPFNDLAFTVPLCMSLGLLLILSTFTYWHLT
jgi:hypothetical protein